MPQLAPPAQAVSDGDTAGAAPGPGAAPGRRGGARTAGTRASTGAVGAGVGSGGGTATARVVHSVGDTLAVRAAGTEILRHRYRPVPHPTECPSPFASPLRTLAGRPVTAAQPSGRLPSGQGPHEQHPYVQRPYGQPLYEQRPYDLRVYGRSHPYGQPCPYDRRFEGSGPTRPAGREPPDGGHTHHGPGHGYAELPGVGRLDRTGFTALAANGRTAFTETVDWLTEGGERWIAEERTWAIRDLDTENSCWTLEFRTALLNVRGRTLHFGAPASQQPAACGAFWRGPSEFAAGAVCTPDAEGDAVAGRRAPWLARTAEPRGAGGPGAHPGAATLVFAADPRLPGGAPRWSVRGGPAPVVSPSLALGGALPLAPAATLRLAYRLVIADGVWDRDRIAAYLAAHPW